LNHAEALIFKTVVSCLSDLPLRLADEDPFKEMHSYMQEMFSAVLEVAAPEPQPGPSSAGRRYLPGNQQAAQSSGSSSSGRTSGILYRLGGDDHSSRRDTDEESRQTDATPLSGTEEDFNFSELAEILAALRNSKHFVEGGLPAPETEASEGDSSGQMLKGGAEAPVESPSLGTEVPLHLDPVESPSLATEVPLHLDPVESSSLGTEVLLHLDQQISMRLQQFKTMSKELEELLHKNTVLNPDEVAISDQAKTETGTAEEEPNIEEDKTTGSIIETCNLTDSTNDKPTVCQSHIKGHSDENKTSFDASTSSMHGVSVPYALEYWAWQLHGQCFELRSMCENVSAALLNTSDICVKCAVSNPERARRCLHLAEVASILFGFSSRLRSTMGHIMDNIWGSDFKEVACMSFAIKKLSAVFPVLESVCGNLYSDYLQTQSTSDYHKEPVEGKEAHADTKLDTAKICRRMDAADEQLGKAIRKLRIIHGIELNNTETPTFPLQLDTEAQQGDSKENFVSIARKLLLIEREITSLLEARTYQGQGE
jgi:hypothetical protein